MKKIMVFGAFDGLHPGHLDFFRQAKKHGDTLVVSVGLDVNVEKIKGKKPLFNQRQRVNLVETCRLVDKAVLGAKDDFYGHIKSYAPNVICLGYDQWANEADLKIELDRVGLKDCKIIRLSAFDEKRAKSSILKEKSVDF